MRSLNQFSASLLPWFGGLLLTTVVWQMGVLVTRQLDMPQNVELSSDSVNAWLVSGKRPSVESSELAYTRLFPRQEVASKPVEVPKTPLKMVLSAVFVAPVPESSGAIIATLGTNATYYKVGDEVETGIRLIEVFEDHVVLDRQGMREALYFKESARSGALESVTPSVKPSVESPVVTVQSPLSASSRGTVDNLPQTELGTDIRRLNPAAFMQKYEQKLAENPSALLAEAGIIPASGGGYQVSNSPYSGLLTSAGLEMGDVILSVNGNALGDPQSDARLLGTLAKQKEVEVMIQRGSRQFAVTFPISR